MASAPAGVTLVGMAVRELDLEVLRGRNVEEKFQADGDPKDARWLEQELRSWLRANRWDPSRWREFELVARQHGRSDRLARVRA